MADHDEHPGSIVYGNVALGEGTRVEDPCIVGKPPRGAAEGELATRIGADGVIRPFTTIYAGTTIGDRFQTGQGVSIREDNVIGDDVSIGTAPLRPPQSDCFRCEREHT